MEIKWTDSDDETGLRRFIRAERFAGFWRFHYRETRRGVWTRLHPATLDMWAEVLDALKRRYRRREGVTEDDIKQVESIVADLERKRQATQEP